MPRDLGRMPSLLPEPGRSAAAWRAENTEDSMVTQKQFDLRQDWISLPLRYDTYWRHISDGNGNIIAENVLEKNAKIILDAVTERMEELFPEAVRK